jgi:hypothetical protein
MKMLLRHCFADAILRAGVAASNGNADIHNIEIALAAPDPSIRHLEHDRRMSLSRTEH